MRPSLKAYSILFAVLMIALCAVLFYVYSGDTEASFRSCLGPGKSASNDVPCCPGLTSMGDAVMHRCFPCGDGKCQTQWGETAERCPQDCASTAKCTPAGSLRLDKECCKGLVQTFNANGLTTCIKCGDSVCDETHGETYESCANAKKRVDCMPTCAPDSYIISYSKKQECCGGLLTLDAYMVTCKGGKVQKCTVVDHDISSQYCYDPQGPVHQPSASEYCQQNPDGRGGGFLTSCD